VTDTPALAREYASAWVSVLPSVDEAFGLVLLESLAAGTPVVAARSGGPPEIVSSDRVGRLFEPDDANDLAVTLEESLELSGKKGTAAACRKRASEYDWSSVVKRYEDVYAAVLGTAPVAT
jgi:phosphatidyl-myo-inositol alpha-mannosyltransferase